MTTATMKRPAAPAITLTKLFIDNNFVDPVGGKTFDTYNPPPRVLAKVAEGSAADVDRAVKAARKALESGPWRRWTPPNASAHVQASRPHREETPRNWPCWSRSTAAKRSGTRVGHDRRGEHAALLRRLGRQDRGRTVPVRGNFLSYTLRQPVGVVGQTSPGTSPCSWLAGVGPGPGVGNTLVMKPAEQTQLIACASPSWPATPASRRCHQHRQRHGETTGAALVVHRRGQDRLHRARR